MKFSTIIPIYNAEQTLERCLKGFLHQTFTDFELILVNDGSTDRSADICRRYASQHPFIRWTDKPNGGVSSARNAGIDMAQGEYLTFADADDEVNPSFLANFAEQCDECDLLMQSIKQTDADGKTRSDHLQESQCKTRDDMAQLIFHLHDRDIPISVWAICFRSSMVNKSPYVKMSISCCVACTKAILSAQQEKLDIITIRQPTQRPIKKEMAYAPV